MELGIKTFHVQASLEIEENVGDGAVYTTPLSESWNGRGESDIGVYPDWGFALS